MASLSKALTSELKKVGNVDYRGESMQLLELMQKAGVLEKGVAEKILAEVEDDELEVIDVEPVDEGTEDE